MDTINFPVFQIGNNILKLHVSTELYAKDAINAVCYKYSGICYVHQELDANIVNITLEAKEGNAIDEEIAKQFCNDLIDQQIRYVTEQKFGHIRDMIVEEAFKPVNIK